MPCQKEWNNQSKSIRGLPNIIWNLFSIMQGLKNIAIIALCMETKIVMAWCMENIFLPRGPVAANSLVVLPNASKKNIAQRQRLAFCRGLPQPHRLLEEQHQVERRRLRLLRCSIRQTCKCQIQYQESYCSWTTINSENKMYQYCWATNWLIEKVLRPVMLVVVASNIPKRCNHAANIFFFLEITFLHFLIN